MSSHESDECTAESKHVEAECQDCPWRYFRHQADEVAGMTGDRMDDIIGRQAELHRRATDHEVSTDV